MTAAPLRPRLASALDRALADSPTGERLAEVAVECVVAEIDERPPPASDTNARGWRVDYDQGWMDGYMQAESDLRAALTDDAPTAGTVAVPHEGRCS